MKLSNSRRALLRALSVSCIELTIAFASQSTAAPFTIGNLLVSSNDRLYEYSQFGVLLQVYPIPYSPGMRPVTEEARDVAFGPGGSAIVYNGTFDPLLSKLDAASSSWTHRTYPGWSTFNNISYGGIAVRGNHAFVSDMETFGPGDTPKGIVRIDVTTGAGVRFAEDIQTIDLNLGADGLLYALHIVDGNHTEGELIDVYDPTTLSFVRRLNVGPHRAVDVNAAGELFLVDWNGMLEHRDPLGNVIKTKNLQSIEYNLYDIDLGPGGRIAIGSRNADVILTDVSFNSLSSFDVGTQGTFVAFVPEPAGASIAVIALSAVAAQRRRRCA
jgi:hypothetical protein